MRAAWEWRSFQTVESPLGLLELAADAAERLQLTAPLQIMPETDTYLVIPGMRHNLKLRRGSMEIKRLVTRLRNGYSLWEDKQVWSFPLGAAELQSIWSLLPGHRRKPPEMVVSPVALLHSLRSRFGNMAVVQMYKHRIRLDNGRARLEIADLELPGAARWLSYCADGYDLEAVQAIVRTLHPNRGTKILSYVDFLQEAVWWFPTMPREVVGIDGR